MASETVLSNHFQDMIHRLDNDRKTSAKYCDISLIVDEHKYPAHKCIFGLLSPFFDKMFSIEMKERYDNEAVIKGISKEVFEAILDLIYTGSVVLNMENVFGIIEAAHYMDLPYIKECCSTYLGKNITTENWSGILAYGKRYGYEVLLEKVDENLVEIFTDIIELGNFVDLEKDDLKHLLGLEKKFELEEKVYEAVIGWIRHEVTNREQHAEELLSLLKFSKMPLDFLTQVVAKEKLLGTSHCAGLVLNAIANFKPAAKQKATKDKSTSCELRTNVLNGFIAVDGRTIWKSKQNQLTQKKLSYDHTGGSAVLSKRRLHVIGGRDCYRSEEYCLFDLVLESAVVNLKYRYAAASVVFDDYIYLTGGLSSPSSTENIPVSMYGKKWTLCKNMDFNRSGHALVSFAGLLFVIGGSTDAHQSMLCFDWITKESKVLTPMTCPRQNLAALVFNDHIYAIGGTIDEEKETTVVEKFYPMLQRWKRIADLLVARYRPGACVLNDKIVVVGGGSSVVEVYDEKNDAWEIVGNYEELKDVFAIFSVNNF